MTNQPTTRPVRTRFAPSPTGSLHIGGLRTALFNWLYARKMGGQFILRIEDTDQKRYDPTALKTLVEALRWAGLQWDEGPEVGGAYGPYVQSERLDLYQKWANTLIENGKAYKCFCTAERLKQLKESGEGVGYDRHCRHLTPEQIAAKEAAGETYVVRFKTPLEGHTVVNDLLLGDVSFENALQQDTVLLKSDGFPTYHLAHVVDDHLMEISHVMRANEWFSSYPLHWQLWDAFGWERPIYVHLPVMLNPNGKGKISKRKPPKDDQGNIIPVLVHDYIHGGYLPEAILNFLMNTGWSFGDDIEQYTIAQAQERYDINQISPVNTAFPTHKLNWLNAEYLRAMPAEVLAPLLQPGLEAAGFLVDPAVLLKAAPLAQPRIKTLNDAASVLGLFFEPTFTAAPSKDILSQTKLDVPQSLNILQTAYDALASVTEWTPEAQKLALQEVATELNLKPNQLFGALRVATTAKPVSPPLFETMEIFGKETSLQRIQQAMDNLRSSLENALPA